MSAAARTISALGLALAVVGSASPSEAGGRRHGGWHGHSHYGGPRVVVGVGPGFGWGPGYRYGYAYGYGYGPAWYRPWPYFAYTYPYAYAPPPVVLQPPTVYVERPPASAAPSGSWYYCESAGEYYPRVASCPEPWVPVAPRPE